ncbi:MAG TPA: S1-like domain-containing RNA-binding protein [Polyangiaceae bacterium]|jgi:predicted RNA-binding protein (virulence factor B family)|nr:S1-like domain-containing RNA-binding protein [Polyangiaceae bacterium]
MMESLLGQRRTLLIRRIRAPGAYLATDPQDQGEEAEGILLPRAEVPEGAEAGAEIEVFVYLDSEDRPIATTRFPRLSLGEVAFLDVTDVTDIGAFVDWGLQKELLLPFAEQTREVRVGDRHPIGLYVDKSGRLAGTMRVAEMLGPPPHGRFERDAWVDGEAWRNEPILGLFVIVERAWVGLLPAGEPHRLTRGQAAEFRVANLLADGKIELSLRGHGHQEFEADAQRILATLARAGAPRWGDRSAPHEIRRVFGLSKKAFKRAVGHLLKVQAVRIDEQGFVVPSTRAPRAT